MDISTLLTIIRDALQQIIEPRFYETERGYQGDLVARISRYIGNEEYIVEQEYQKQKRKHNLTIRPDILIHQPFNPRRHASRSDGNLAAIELKLDATPEDAQNDLEKLRSIMTTLNYPLGVFANIGSNNTHFDSASRDFSGRLVMFAVTLNNGVVSISEQGN
jgi:hypothetical protein